MKKNNPRIYTVTIHSCNNHSFFLDCLSEPFLFQEKTKERKEVEWTENEENTLIIYLVVKRNQVVGEIKKHNRIHDLFLTRTRRKGLLIIRQKRK